MKALLLTLLVLSPATVLACKNKIDPKKVILLVDTNTSEPEIATAQKAACERGEKLMVVPQNYKEYSKYIRVLGEAEKKKSVQCQFSNSPGCIKAKEETELASKALEAFKNSQKNIPQSVREALQAIKDAGAKLQNFTISGHDGGGEFGGLKGSFSRQTLAGLMGEFDEINDVKSILLLGCYTGTQNEVMEWKNIFPKTKLIGGYDGSAPLSDRPQGHQYIHDLLTKEKELSSQADGKKLQAYVNSNFKGLSNLNAALYIQCSDGSSIQDYYYGSKNSRKFSEMHTKECLEKMPELTKLNLEIEKYKSGELEPPKDTRNGQLRAMYNFARAYEHCSEITGVNININALFNLLFYEGVKQSFAHYYKADLQEAAKLIEAMTPEEIEKNILEQVKVMEDEYAKDKLLLEKIEKNPAAYIAEQEEEYKKLKEKADGLMNDPAYAGVKHLIPENGFSVFAPLNVPLTHFTKFQELYNAVSAAALKKSVLDSEKKSPEAAVSQRKANLEYYRNNIDSMVVNARELKDPSNKVWVPTAENLKKYSRADLLKNLHRMNTVLSLVNVGKARDAMNWLNSVTSNHLQSFDNPFSWHEYTGRSVEQPSKPQTLSDYQNGTTGQTSLIGNPFGGGYMIPGPSITPGFGF